MGLFEGHELRCLLACFETRQRGQTGPEPVLRLGVDPWIAAEIGKQIPARRRRELQPLDHPWEGPPADPITLPDQCPLRAARADPLRGDQDAVGLGIELPVRLTTAAEGVPAGALPRGDGPLGVVHPGQQVADRVGAQQGIKVRRLQAPAPEVLQRGVQQQVQRPQQGALGRLVGGDIEGEPAAAAGEEGVDRPVPAVELAPIQAAILQLGQRLQFPGTGLDGAQVRPRHAGQVEDGHHARRPVGFVEGPGEHALDPDGGTTALLRREVPQGQQFGQQAPQPRRDAPPLTLVIGPEHGGGPRLVGTADVGSRPQGFEDAVEDASGHG